MNFSIETRVPFLDSNFVNMASEIPTELLIKNGVLKYILKERTKELMSDVIYKNPKKYGFTTPQEKWKKTLFCKNPLTFLLPMTTMLWIHMISTFL